MTGCFAGDGVLEYLGKAPKGPAAIKAALSAGRRDPRLTFVRHHITNPLIAVVLGVLILHEPFSVRMAAAAAIVLAGMAMVRRD